MAVHKQNEWSERIKPQKNRMKNKENKCQEGKRVRFKLPRSQLAKGQP